MGAWDLFFESKRCEEDLTWNTFPESFSCAFFFFFLSPSFETSRQKSTNGCQHLERLGQRRNEGLSPDCISTRPTPTETYLDSKRNSALADTSLLSPTYCSCCSYPSQRDSSECVRARVFVRPWSPLQIVDVDESLRKRRGSHLLLLLTNRWNTSESFFESSPWAKAPLFWPCCLSIQRSLICADCYPISSRHAFKF